MKYTLPPLTQGSFWGLQRRIREGQAPDLGCVTCCELGFDLDRLLHPVRPRWIIQNAGGCCSALESIGPLPAELILLSHPGCHFLGSASVEEHLYRQIQCLGQLAQKAPGISPLWFGGAGQTQAASCILRVHPWSLSGNSLQVYVMDQQRLVTPLQLPTLE